MAERNEDRRNQGAGSGGREHLAEAFGAAMVFAVGDRRQNVEGAADGQGIERRQQDALANDRMPPRIAGSVEHFG